MSASRTVEQYIENPGSRRKRRRTFYLLLTFIIIFGITLGTGWFVMRSGFFSVRDIRVENATLFTKSEIFWDADVAIFRNADWSHVLGIDNMLVWPSALEGSALALTPQIERMMITKDYLHGVIDITVSAREPAGIWCSATHGTDSNTTTTESKSFSCYTFDKSSFAYASAPHAEGGLLHVLDDYTGRKIGIGSYVLPQNVVPRLLSIFHVLAQSKTSVKEMRLENLALEEVQVVTYGGPTIFFGLGFNAGYALPALLSLESRPGFKALQYVDFRTENRVYYR